MSFIQDREALVLVRPIRSYLMWGVALQLCWSVGHVTCLFAQKVTLLQFWKLSMDVVAKNRYFRSYHHVVEKYV